MIQRLFVCSMLSLVLLACENDPGDVCGDGFCAPRTGESCGTCAADCGSCAACGDGTCAPSTGESCTSCPADCGSCDETCGNGMCLAGETCSTCPGDCGACSGSCSPATCAGCCTGAGICDGGASIGACGAGGNACMACGGGLACSGGGCVVDPASRWNVLLDTLTVPQRHHGGETWDAFGGAPDPTVQVRVGSESATPSAYAFGGDDVFFVGYAGRVVVENVRASDLSAHLSFWVYDEDTTNWERVGACRAEVTEATFMGGEQTVNCAVDPSTDQSGFTLTWHLDQF